MHSTIFFCSPNFSFTAGNTHFVCLNTNAFEYDYSVAIPDFTFIKSDYNNLMPEVTRTVVAMHAMPHSDQFNNNVADLFETEMFHAIILKKTILLFFSKLTLLSIILPKMLSNRLKNTLFTVNDS